MTAVVDTFAQILAMRARLVTAWMFDTFGSGPYH